MSSDTERQIKSLDEMESLASEFVAGISKARDSQSPNDPNNRNNNASGSKPAALIVALSGDLGSGKTAFVQKVAKVAGITDMVTSPTFIIEKIYRIPTANPQISPTFTHLIHIDAYRLEGGNELRHLGWDEIAANPANLILIEWPEKVADCVPSDALRLRFTFIDDTTRRVSYA